MRISIDTSYLCFHLKFFTPPLRGVGKARTESVAAPVGGEFRARSEELPTGEGAVGPKERTTFRDCPAPPWLSCSRTGTGACLYDVSGSLRSRFCFFRGGSRTAPTTPFPETPTRSRRRNTRPESPRSEQASRAPRIRPTVWRTRPGRLPGRDRPGCSSNRSR